MKIFEMKQVINFTKPNFRREYEEARRYKELKDFSILTWIKFAEKGKQMTLKNNILKDVNNTDANNNPEKVFHKLDKEKKKRFKKALKDGTMEMPILMKYHKEYELVSGNTRLTGLSMLDIIAEVWFIDFDKEIDDFKD